MSDDSYYNTTDDVNQLLYDVEKLKKKFNLYEVVIDTRNEIADFDNENSIPDGYGGVRPFFIKWCEENNIGKDFWPKETCALPVVNDQLDGQWTFLVHNQLVFFFVELRAAILFKLRWQ